MPGQHDGCSHVVMSGAIGFSRNSTVSMAQDAILRLNHHQVNMLADEFASQWDRLV